MGFKKPTQLRVLLVQKGLNQRKLAEMSGVTEYQISQICSGKRSNMMLDTAKRIAVSMGVTLDEAFGGDEMYADEETED